jgi:hypothetical protein
MRLKRFIPDYGRTAEKTAPLDSIEHASQMIRGQITFFAPFVSLVDDAKRARERAASWKDCGYNHARGWYAIVFYERGQCNVPH